MQRWGRTMGVPLLIVAGLTACGDQARSPASGEALAPASAVPALSPTPTASTRDRSAPAQEPAEQPTGPAAEGTGGQPAEQPTPVPAPDSGGPDLDGDGRADSVVLNEVPDMGWSFDVRLADGRETSAPLPDDGVVREDVEIRGAVDLDHDGADEVLVRTLRAVGGENVVVFRLVGDGVWLVRTDEGVPWELSTAGGMTGPRSYDCVGGEVRTRGSERKPDGTYRAMTWRWTLNGHVAGPLGGARDDALAAEDVSLDPSTCRA